MKIDFEYFMQEQHCEQYVGTKYAMVDDFADWCDGLSIDEWFNYGNKFANNYLSVIGWSMQNLDNTIATLKECNESLDRTLDNLRECVKIAKGGME